MGIEGKPNAYNWDGIVYDFGKGLSLKQGSMITSKRYEEQWKRSMVSKEDSLVWPQGHLMWLP